MIRQLREDLIGLRHGFVWQYLLLDGDNVVSLDSGLFLAARRVRRWFERTGRTPSQLRAILLTHGHIDHVAGAEGLRQWSGAPAYLHPEDLAIAQGRFRYHGAARVCGMLEALGRPFVGYRRPTIDRDLSDGDELPFWGGLRVIGLPGHTPGHVGFYNPSRRILFCGDALVASSERVTFPSRIFNHDQELMRRSILKVVDLPIDWIYPMHHRNLRHNLMHDIRRYAEQQTERVPCG